MRPQSSLRVAGGLYITLGVMVLCVLWIFPQVGVPEAAINSKSKTMMQTAVCESGPDVIKTARGWGDINAFLFIGLGGILITCASAVDQESYAASLPLQVMVDRLLMANEALAFALLFAATFHTVVLKHGPPPPVFLACALSAIVSHVGWDQKKGVCYR